MASCLQLGRCAEPQLHRLAAATNANTRPDASSLDSVDRRSGDEHGRSARRRAWESGKGDIMVR